MPRGPDFYLKPRVTRLQLPRAWPVVWDMDCRACGRADAATSFAWVQESAASHESKPRQTMSRTTLPPQPCTPETRFQRSVERMVDLHLPALKRLADL